ncbi:unnamed protein product [Protopolystoma xenopodis]|uniref:Uncharacterized protein n=1 Tax=Protopolystoma xenopodis TaxID=117903 RepID=A0A448WGQ1_9PLAT|nr:unnamed protein product [Protopolystoma xenopodis]
MLLRVSWVLLAIVAVAVWTPIWVVGNSIMRPDRAESLDTFGSMLVHLLSGTNDGIEDELLKDLVESQGQLQNQQGQLPPQQQQVQTRALPQQGQQNISPKNISQPQLQIQNGTQLQPQSCQMSGIGANSNSKNQSARIKRRRVWLRSLANLLKSYSSSQQQQPQQNQQEQRQGQQYTSQNTMYGGQNNQYSGTKGQQNTGSLRRRRLFNAYQGPPPTQQESTMQKPQIQKTQIQHPQMQNTQLLQPQMQDSFSDYQQQGEEQEEQVEPEQEQEEPLLESSDNE